MPWGPVGFVAVYALLCAALLRASFRVDRLLGNIVAIGLALYVSGDVLIGPYLEQVRGRPYLASDEIGYYREGLALVDAWREGDTDFTLAIPGGFPYVNAAAIALWGPGSLLPMRLLSGLVGAACLFAVFFVTSQITHNPAIPRAAAVLLLLTPSVFVWAVTNLKDGWLRLMVLVVLGVFLSLFRRFTWTRFTALLIALLLLGYLRHYHAAIVGWLLVPSFIVLSGEAWKRRAFQAAVLAAGVGAVLNVVTGTFMAYNMRSETVARYVTVAPSGEPLPGAADAGSGQATSGRRGVNGAGPKPGAAREEQAPDPLLGRDRFAPIGESAGVAQQDDAARPGIMQGVLAVLFGRFRPLAEGGTVMTYVLLPEWLASFLMVPMALLGAAAGFRRGERLVLVPSAFVAGMVALLAWVHGDVATTLRFRTVFWPLLLMLAAMALPWLHEQRLHLVGRPLPGGRT